MQIQDLRIIIHQQNGAIPILIVGRKPKTRQSAVQRFSSDRLCQIIQRKHRAAALFLQERVKDDRNLLGGGVVLKQFHQLPTPFRDRDIQYHRPGRLFQHAGEPIG